MRSMVLVSVVLMATTAWAADNPVARLGLKDGWYCRGGDAGPEGTILVAAKSSPPFIGIDGLDCHDPVLRGGKLVARTCYANGARKLSLTKSFSANGDIIRMNGARYRLTPQKKGEIACSMTTSALP